MCNGRKTRFTLAQAINVLKKAKKSHNRWRKEKRYYYCDDCETYHVTSEENNPFETIDIRIKLGKKWKKVLKKSRKYAK